MTVNNSQIARSFGARLSQAGHAGAGYFKVLLDLLTGRRNLFF